MKNTLLAKKIRRRVLKLLYDHTKCHLGSNMSVIEILVALYFNVMKPEDIFIPKGHSAVALYTVLAEKGLFTDKDLDCYFKTHNLVSHKVPGVIFGSSLGQSLSVACGLALADRSRRVFCLLTDGEMQEGSTWEAIGFAAHHNLKNLIAIIDNNRLQAFGITREVLNIEPLSKKLESFGWQVGEVDGHNLDELENIFYKPLRDEIGTFAWEERFKENKPICIIANTTKGKGVSFAENKLEWHYLNLSKQQYEKAIKENE